MKKKFSWMGACALGLLAACTSPGQNRFSVKGTIDAADGESIYLTYQLGDSTVMDTAIIQNGAFAFSGEIDRPVAGGIYMGSLQDRSNACIRQLYIDPAEMTVDITLADFAKAKVQGSKTQEDADSLEEVIQALSAPMSALRDSIVKYAENDELRNTYYNQIDSLSQLVRSAYKTFATTQTASTYAPFALRMVMNEMKYDELKAVYEGFTPEVQRTAVEVKEEVDKLAAIQPGQPAPEVSGTNPAGEAIKLSNFKGKVVLLDFWATWCRPCRQSFPHVRALYAQYHEQGLEVLCVGDDDENVEGWKQAIESDSLQNFHHVLRGLKRVMKDGKFVKFDKSTDMDEAYAIHYIPSKFLIDREGKLLGRFDDEEELNQKLKEIFGE